MCGFVMVAAARCMLLTSASVMASITQHGAGLNFKGGGDRVQREGREGCLFCLSCLEKKRGVLVLSVAKGVSADTHTHKHTCVCVCVVCVFVCVTQPVEAVSP